MRANYSPCYTSFAQQASLTVSGDGGFLAFERLALPYTGLVTAIRGLSGTNSSLSLDAVTVPQRPEWGTLSGMVVLAGGTGESTFKSDPPQLMSAIYDADLTVYDVLFPDAAALLAFKESGNGENLETWRGATDPCASWAGVSCDTATRPIPRRVIVLDPAMANTNSRHVHNMFAALTGDVATLSGCTSMRSLSLMNTAVSGDVGGLGSLTSLAVLQLGYTAVTGNVGDLGSLTSLTTLALGGTSVTGDVGDLGSLTSLTYLDLYHTAVSGDAAGLSLLTSLTTLYLGTAVSGCDAFCMRLNVTVCAC
eukprot:SAG11_NODE_1943_length_4020_cov_8.087733_2_plen_308_part_00